MQSTFAARLKEGMEQNEMTQARLARLVGIDKATINNYVHLRQPQKRAIFPCFLRENGPFAV